MTDFCLTDEQWTVVVSAMATFDHSATEENRAEIEATCRAFIRRRLEVGKVRSVPNKKAKPWQDIHDAAQKLRDAVKADPDVKAFIWQTLPTIKVLEKKPLPIIYDDTSPKFGGT